MFDCKLYQEKFPDLKPSLPGFHLGHVVSGRAPTGMGPAVFVGKVARYPSEFGSEGI
jgi:hypothetical protein